ncbi:hypothetical protein SEA_SEKHMET_33 [Gordonia phage Sekhmet]|uniref:Fido domain-containing protein n=1 Tax=Gordonia phage Sekhmet TaxID=2591209 RepID=A0A514DIC8_9CAUD|nr:hypothetical protein PP503_gp33 [Gordonia phage Sekhmet]QDH93371.1 hypothetical protein SEA_SEKHMET_33 [Gordonia phage Sekhmet]
MTEYVYPTVAQIIAINADQDGGVGVSDLAGIEAAAARPNSAAFDTEMFPRIWDKAAAYVHAFATTQYFTDGNKRTAWLTAVTFLAVNNRPLPLVPDIEAETFVQGVAQKVFDTSDDPDAGLRKAAEWFQTKWEQRRRGAAQHPKLEYAFLCHAADFSDGTFNTVAAGLVGFTSMGALEFPLLTRLELVGRVHWSPDDTGVEHVITAQIDPVDPVAQKRVNRNRGECVPQFFVSRSAHAHHHDEPMPLIFSVTLNPVFLECGKFRVAIHIDGDFAGEIPFEIDETKEPDYALLQI